MKKILLISIAIMLLIAFDCFAYTKQTFMVPMKDGTKLYTEVYFPQDYTENEKLSAILTRTVYGTANDRAVNLTLLKLLVDDKRNIYVLQDCRGTGKSEGLFNLFQDDAWFENKDGVETIHWIASQQWSNSKVSMNGSSASSGLLNLAALSNPSDLVCGFSAFCHWNGYFDAYYPGGVLSGYDYWVKNMTKHDPSIYDELLNHYMFDEHWEKWDFSLRKEYYNIPVLHATGWYDVNLGPSYIKAYHDVNNFGGDNAREKQKLMIGPWKHGGLGGNVVGQITFPINAKIDFNNLKAEWFDYWMNDKKDSSIENLANVSLYLMGPVDTSGYWNSWLYFSDLPFADTDTMSLYLSNDRTFAKINPNENELTLVFDPKNPFYSNIGLLTIPYCGPKDINQVWNDEKVLTFESPVYDEPYDIFGGINLEVYLSSDREDTDVFAQLVDIYPDGKKIFITDGIQRARFRNGFDKEDFLIPGQVAKLSVDLHHSAYSIVPGHRLGLLLTCSNSASYYPNPNTRDPVNKAKDTLIANNTFHFGGDNATVLVLPIRKPGAVSVRETINKQDVSISPNPFSQSTSINYELQTAGYISLKLYDIFGNEMAVLVDGWKEAGSHKDRFNGSGLAPGVYFFMLRAGERVESGKLVLIK